MAENILLPKARPARAARNPDGTFLVTSASGAHVYNREQYPAKDRYKEFRKSFDRLADVAFLLREVELPRSAPDSLRQNAEWLSWLIRAEEDARFLADAIGHLIRATNQFLDKMEQTYRASGDPPQGGHQQSRGPSHAA